MMYLNKSNRRMMLKALFAVSVAALSISTFATPKIVKDFDKSVNEIEKKGKGSQGRWGSICCVPTIKQNRPFHKQS